MCLKYVFLIDALANNRSIISLRQSSSWNVSGTVLRFSFTPSRAHSRAGRAAMYATSHLAWSISLSMQSSVPTSVLVRSNSLVPLCWLLSGCYLRSAYRMTSESKVVGLNIEPRYVATLIRVRTVRIVAGSSYVTTSSGHRRSNAAQWVKGVLF